MVIELSRPELDDYYCAVVVAISRRASCARRSVGCILTDSSGRQLSSGYNGPPTGFDNCIDKPCPGAKCKSGEGLDLCEAVHAEQNALLQCPDTQRIHTAYCTTAPCIHCVKLLLNTSCKRIVFIEEYPHERSKELWERRGEWIQLPLN